MPPSAWPADDGADWAASGIAASGIGGASMHLGQESGSGSVSASALLGQPLRADAAWRSWPIFPIEWESTRRRFRAAGHGCEPWVVDPTGQQSLWLPLSRDVPRLSENFGQMLELA